MFVLSFHGLCSVFVRISLDSHLRYPLWSIVGGCHRVVHPEILCFDLFVVCQMKTLKHVTGILYKKNQ